MEFKDKKETLLKYLEKNNTGHSQSELTKILNKKFGYINHRCGKVSIGLMLIQLKEEGKVYFKTSNEGRGSLPKKIWFKKESN